VISPLFTAIGVSKLENYTVAMARACCFDLLLRRVTCCVSAVSEAHAMKSWLMVLGLILGACGMEERHADRPGPPSDQKGTPKMESAMKQDTTLQATSRDGTRIAFEKTGSGPALVLVSGALSQRSLFRDQPLVPSLAEHFTVYIYDRRGRGQSTDVQPYAVAREIEDLEALLADAGGPAYLYGVSSGGALALQATAKLGPSKIAKLAIYDPPYGQAPEDFDEQKQRVGELVGKRVPGEAASYFLSAIGTPPEALEAMKRSPEWETFKNIDFTLAYDYEVLGHGAVPEDVVKAIRVPTLVMTGEKSMAFMRPAADRIAALVPQSQRKILEGQAHQAEAGVVVPVLVEFFTGSSPR
jgi:pimeloyl-ACP methyl ester carboxylesterase